MPVRTAGTGAWMRLSQLDALALTVAETRKALSEQLLAG